MANEDEQLDILSLERIRTEYGLNPKTVRAAFNTGEFAASLVGRKLFIRRAVLENWIAGKEEFRRKHEGQLTEEARP